MITHFFPLNGMLQVRVWSLYRLFNGSLVKADPGSDNCHQQGHTIIHLLSPDRRGYSTGLFCCVLLFLILRMKLSIMKN